MPAHRTASHFYARVLKTTQYLVDRWTTIDRGWRAVVVGVVLLALTFSPMTIPW